MYQFRTYALALLASAMIVVQAQVTPTSQMEKLDRGVVAVSTSSTSNFISWRLLGTDDTSSTTFNLLRDGQVIASGLNITNYTDRNGSLTSQYQVQTLVNGQVTESSAEVLPWTAKYKSLKLDRPAGGIHATWGDDRNRSKGNNLPYAYYPNDMSVGDVDGDGQYELILKWESTHAQDNSYSLGETGNAIIDCYRLDGTRLWRIDLGPNIRDGAHYTPFMVYDFDGDGKAEMMCKTAAGSKDGLGGFVNQAATDETIKAHDNTKDYRNSGGHILSGPEYLTVFDGLTGRAIHTTWYLPGRAGTGSKTSTERGDELGKVSSYPSGFWGDNYGGRSERFLGAVAYVNGADKPASAVFCRGYYTQAYVWAVSFDGNRLHTEWLHASPSTTQWLVFASKWNEGQAGLEYTIDGDRLKRIPIKTAPKNTSGVTASDSNGGIAGSNTLYGNGNHNLSVADVDGDGCDEIIWGSAALDNDGTLLYATGMGHGDAIHVGKMIPDREGLQVFDVHEEKLNANFGSWDLHDARTGEILFHGGSAGSDNGRGMAADLTGKDGYEFWSADERTPRSALTGKSTSIKNCSVNFRIYWDGSYQDQLFDGSYKYTKTSESDIDAVWRQTAHAEPVITKWNGSSFTTVTSFYTGTYNNAQTANYTKATPCLQADIFGDWREELVMWNKKDSAEIMIFTTILPTEYAVPTLMHDHVYRMGVAWQNTAYNQPPHLGYYLPDYIHGRLPNDIRAIRPREESDAACFYDLHGRRLSTPQKGINIIRKGSQIKKIIIK